MEIHVFSVFAPHGLNAITKGTCNAVMLNYAGEYCKYCDACQAAVTVIRNSDAALKSCLEWLTMSYLLGNW